jgi:YD repeat-containing protein
VFIAISGLSNWVAKETEMSKLIKVVVLAAGVLAATASNAQQADSSYTFYGADGRIAGRSTTDGHGTTLFYGPDGRLSGRAITTPGVGTGTVTTYYGPDGRMVGVSRSK